MGKLVTNKMKIDAYSRSGGLKGYMAGGDVTDVYDKLPNKTDEQLIKELNAKESTFLDLSLKQNKIKRMLLA